MAFPRGKRVGIIGIQGAIGRGVRQETLHAVLDELDQGLARRVWL